jgi:ankyrin repeat protein
VVVFFLAAENQSYFDKSLGDPLQTAAHKGNEALVKLLLDHGADVKALEGDNGQFTKL